MAQTFQQYLYKRTQDYLRQSDKEILDAASLLFDRNSDHLLDRIENFRREKMTEEEQKTITVEDVRQQIISNPVVRAHFRKDPTRQSIHENSQIEWLQKVYPDAKKMLAARGGTYLDKEGNLKTDTPRPVDATKTLDVSIPSKNAMAVLKYSTTEGGAQDNQFRDVKNFIAHMGYHFVKPSNWTFHFYLDGPYYTDRRMEELRGMVDANLKEKIIITNVSSLTPPN